MERQRCPDVPTPRGASGRSADVWGAEDMGCAEHGTGVGGGCFALGFRGLDPCFIFYFLSSCLVYPKTKNGFCGFC